METEWFKEGLRFQCTGCGKCCTGSPGYVFLSLQDLERLAAHFGLSAEDFAQKYTRLVDGQYALIDRPESFDCIFLQEKKCTVYEARPVQCKTFPWWIQNLKDKSDWKEAQAHCEGISEEAPLVSAIEITSQCMTYLDNLLDQNFTLGP